jgi:hypothetical protein
MLDIIITYILGCLVMFCYVGVLDLALQYQTGLAITNKSSFKMSFKWPLWIYSLMFLIIRTILTNYNA